MEKEKVDKKEIWSWIITALIALFISFTISLFAKPTVVSGQSMLPTYQDGDYLLVNRLAYKFGEPHKQDIAIIKSKALNDKILIKRIIATGGDRVKIKNGKVYVNGKELNEPYTKDGVSSGDLDVVVPEDHVFVLGDNRLNSLDSEEIGFISDDELIGKVYFKVF